VTASSGTVLANLAYLIGAVVVAVIAGVLIWLRHRQPKSVDANMASFRRGLSALAPDDAAGGATRSVDQARIRPIPVGLTHVRLERSPGAGESAGSSAEPVSEEDGGDFGSGRSG
jgi:hypothetical protein